MGFNAENCSSAVSRFNMVDEVYERLRKMITAGILKPGERLNKNNLCEIFQVSRAPLREAIQKLAAKGLLKKECQKGTYVVKLQSRDIEAIFDLRLYLETLAVKESVSRIPENRLVFLKNYFEQEEKSYSGNSEYHKSDDYNIRDMELHFDLIINYSENMILRHLGSNLIDFAEITLNISDVPDSSIREHIEIIDALLLRDSAEAVKAVKKHFKNMKRFAVSELKKNAGQE